MVTRTLILIQSLVYWRLHVLGVRGRRP